MSHLWFPVIQDTLGKSANPGHWQGHSAQALGELASKLSYDGIAAQINSLPTPWSRAIQIEQAIMKPDYPTRCELLNELFGCLAVVGLSDIYNLELRSDLLQLEELCDSQEPAVRSFATSLWETKPEMSQSVLRKLPEGISPWGSLIIFTIDDATHQSQPIGFTSPSSILCPTTQLRHQIAGVPWSREGRFSDPTPHLSLKQHRQPLANWLDQLREEILNCKPNANTFLAEALCKVLKEFTDRLEVEPSKAPEKGTRILDVNNTRFPFLGYAAAPVKSERNFCRVILEDKKQENPKPVILVDPDMKRKLQKAASEIQLYGSDTLETISKDAKRLRERYKEINVVTPDDLFLPNLTLLPGSDALCHSWLPEKLTAHLEVGDHEDTTPLLPFSARLQELFSSKEMKKMVNLAVDRSQGCLVVELILRLEGFEKEEEYRLERSYPLKKAKVLPKVPVIAVWPSIPDGYWHKYWIISQMVAGLSIDATKGWQGPLGKHDEVRYFCSTSFPDLLNVRVNQSPGGLIPLESPETIRATSSDSWSVGLDFGTSFTNWAIWDGNQKPRRLPLKSALWSVTEANDQVKLEFLNRYFLPQEMYPEDENPPTSTSLSVRGCDQEKLSSKEAPELFHEARLHIPQSDEVLKSDLCTGFKWEHPELQEPFLKQLSLMISAHAVRDGVSKIKWNFSYPTTFPENTRIRYQKLWSNLIGDLNNISKLDHELGRNQSEAVAFACCLDENGDGDKMFQHTACMDIGGRTTDISLWQGSSLVHQVSVPFAGQHICTKILDRRQCFASELLDKKLDMKENIGGRSMQPNRFSLIDNYIRFNSKRLLENKLPKLRSAAQSERIKTLEKFISLMALATGGLYHYLGFVVRRLYENQTLERGSCMSVYVGGNGGQFLRWLDPNCQFDQNSKVNTWLTRIQALAINLNNGELAEGTTHLSNNFKDEVAIGLVVGRSRHIRGLDGPAPKPFSGESIIINEYKFAAEDPISLDKFDHDQDIKDMRFSDLTELRRYVRGMVKAMEGLRKDLQIDPLVKESDLEGALGERVLARAQTLCDEHLGDQKEHTKKMGDFLVEPGFFLGLRALVEALAEDWEADKL